MAQERQQQWHPGTAATTTSPKLRPNGTKQWRPAMAPRNGSYDNLAKNLIHHWHPAMAPCRNGSYDDLAKVASQWHPAMTSSNGTQERQQQWQPGTAAAMATSPKVWPINGTQERQLRQPRQGRDIFFHMAILFAFRAASDQVLWWNTPEVIPPLSSHCHQDLANAPCSGGASQCISRALSSGRIGGSDVLYY